jgi:drug/metabolite transporter (DMT)-like permease
MKPPSLRSAALSGILLLIISVTFFGLVDGLSKLLVETQSLGQVVLARYVVPLAALLIVMGPAKWGGLLQSGHRGLQILRGLTPVVVGGAMVIGVKFMPLAEATTILFAAPFLVVAVSALFLGERVGLSAWIAVAAGFLGVLVVARPGFSELSYVAIFPAVAAVFYAVLQITSRQLATLGEDTITTLAWTLLVGTIVAIPLAIADWRPLNATAWLLALGVGATFGLGQYFLVKAFALAPANILAPFTYFQILAAVLFGMTVFNDFPDLWTWAGIAIITASGIYVIGRAGEKTPANEAQPP